MTVIGHDSIELLGYLFCRESEVPDFLSEVLENHFGVQYTEKGLEIIVAGIVMLQAFSH